MENGYLFSLFLAEDNFQRAWLRVSQKNSAGGIDEVTIERFGLHATARLEKLRRDLKNGRYVPTPVRAVTVPKFNTANEYRELGLPTVADKVVQTALLQVVEPLLETVFSPSSFAYRPGKGHRRAIEYVTLLLRKHKDPWVIRHDIHDFFDSIDHHRLLRLVSHYIDSDQRLLELIGLWCTNGVIGKSAQWHGRRAGVGQGHVISPVLANLYLHKLDTTVENLGCSWVRYADDCVAICKDNSTAELIHNKMVDCLGEVGLVLNENNQPITSFADGFSFLGVFFTNSSKTISPLKIKKMEKKIDYLLKQTHGKTPVEVFTSLAMAANGWRRYYGFLDDCEDVFQLLNKRIESRLLKVLRKKIGDKTWPDKPAPDLPRPFIDGSGEELSDNEWQEKLWRKAKTSIVDQVLSQCKKKTTSTGRACESRLNREMIVTAPGHFLGKKGQRIVVRQARKTVAETPCHQLSHIILGGKGVTLSSDAIQLCLTKGIPIHFCDDRGSIFATLKKPGEGKVELSELQIEQKDKEKGLEIAIKIVKTKMKNQLSLLKYFSKYKGESRRTFCCALDEHLAFLTNLIDKIPPSSTGENPKQVRQYLMGLEGSFAGRYWQLFGKLLPVHISFPGRKKKGAKDLVNSLLNYGYGILYAKALHAIHLTGLHPEVGFLHACSNKRPALSFDLVEIFRAPVIDRTVISLLNHRKKLGLADNQLLLEESRKLLAKAVLQNLSREVNFKGAKVSLGTLLKANAEGISQHLQGKKLFTPYLYKW